MSNNFPVHLAQQWQGFAEKENICLTWGVTSPSSQDIMRHKGDFWVKAKLAKSGKSLVVLEQILSHTDQDYENLVKRFEEL